MSDVSSLFTTYKNTMQTSHFFGYLGLHGRTLLSGAKYTSFGWPRPFTSSHGRAPNSRWANALQRDLLAGRIEVLTTPGVILHDLVTNEVKVLSLSGQALGSVDPSWGAYTGV